MINPQPGDPTPLVGSPTDVSSVGAGSKPAHELTAGEQAPLADWDCVAESEDFKNLLAEKRRFILPATIFFVLYYFALPVLVGYARPLMETKVGFVNLAYLFALSQFFVAWIIAALYVRAANRFDKAAASILSKIGNP
jgi:uncharacterized membrane protein (DUF485 family)